MAVEGTPDKQGMVMDFDEIGRLLQELCAELDHRVLIPQSNPAVSVEEREKELVLSVHGKKFLFPREDVVLLPVLNITVEEIAVYFLGKLKRILLGYTNLQRIGVWVEEKPGQGVWVESELK